MSDTALTRVEAVLAQMPSRIVACSGGIDSLLLATIAHRVAAASTLVVHATSPAVPTSATDRVKGWAQAENWQLEIVASGEFQDETYLANPLNRCYFCKTNLYQKLTDIAGAIRHLDTTSVLLSGANRDDLGEYRPGLIAAAEHGVRHPFVEADITKEEIREMARNWALPFAELPASPCLSSRLYTGTRVTASRLAAIEAGETYIRAATSIRVVRCRIRGGDMLIEVSEGERQLISAKLAGDVAQIVMAIEPSIGRVVLDMQAYRPGRAFVEA